MKKNLKTITVVKKLTKLYFDYSNNYNSNVFVHEFFFKKYSKAGVLNAEANLRFFKHYSYNNDVLGIEHSFLLRRENSEYFDFRVWAVSYNNWLILAISWFKPSKPSIDPKHLQTNSNVSYMHKKKLLTKSKQHNSLALNSMQNHLRYSL